MLNSRTQLESVALYSLWPHSRSSRPARNLFMRDQLLLEPDEGAHNRDIHIYRALAPDDGGQQERFRVGHRCCLETVYGGSEAKPDRDENRLRLLEEKTRFGI